MKIVVVDDDPVVGILCEELFSHEGHTVQILNKGSECLEHIKNNPPDVLILDMIMPDISGIEVLRQIKANSDVSQIPVIMLSANLDIETMVKENDIEANAYVQKPFKIPEMLQALKDLV